MKTVSKLILITGLLAAPFALRAETTEKAYVDSYRGRTPAETPVPVKVVAPRVESDYAGLSVKLAFTIDETGAPKDITVLDTKSVPADLGATLADAVAKWKFTPLVRDGKAVASKVVLPVNITDDFNSVNRFAAK